MMGRCFFSSSFPPSPYRRGEIKSQLCALQEACCDADVRQIFQHNEGARAGDLDGDWRAVGAQGGAVDLKGWGGA